MQQVSEEVEAQHMGEQQHHRQEEDAMTNSTQKGEPGNAASSRSNIAADAEQKETSAEKQE
jgi:hypothetical protein